MMLRSAAVGLIWALLVCSTKALFPYGAGNGDATFGPVDDGHVQFYLQYSPLRFFGLYYRDLYIHNNGYVSVGGDVHGYTPPPLASTSYPVIAPYWADVDTRASGCMYYRESLETSLLATASACVRVLGAPYTSFQARSLLIVTWGNVGYYYNHADKTNTFQLVIASNGVRSFMIFLYGQLQWTTGDASGGSYGLGGTEAAVGLGAGDGVGHVTVIGSYAPEVLQVISISNVGILGVIVLSSEFSAQQDNQENVANQDSPQPTMMPMVTAYNRENVANPDSPQPTMMPMVTAYNRGNVANHDPKPMVTAYNRGNVANHDPKPPMASKSSAALEHLEQQLKQY